MASPTCLQYDYTPDQVIWAIVDCGDHTSVVKGTVISLCAQLTVTAETLIYSVRLDGQTTTTQIEETDMFANKTDAVNEYSTRLGT